jgi:hypothetical protein
MPSTVLIGAGGITKRAKVVLRVPIRMVVNKNT